MRYRADFRRSGDQMPETNECFIKTKTGEIVSIPLKATKERKTNLVGKCGSCKWAATRYDKFGKKTSLIDCRHPDKKFKGTANLKERTTKACKLYKEDSAWEEGGKQ